MRARFRSPANPGELRRGRPRKRFGQHFLEPAWVAKLVDAIDPSTDDAFIEIGPGRGAITGPLATRATRVVAVEVDRDLAAELVRRQIPNLTVVVADVLEVDLGELATRLLGASPDRPVRVVGNLPYNISSPILFRLLAASAETKAMRDATLMLQREVADRLIAVPGTGEYGVLTVLTALGADVTAVLNLPPGAFRPTPKVRSSVVRLTFRPTSVPVREPKVLVELVRSVFTQRRKTMANALSRFATSQGMEAKAALEAAGIDSMRRPETLQLIELARLADVFAPR
jgi:16S rRNA (adenine1518-N6/adenine1519-N6)-dimethyltransferase